MVYNWNDKREICRKLYVEDRRTTQQIMDYFKQEFDFSPSKRAFEKQFSRWNFPNKISRLPDSDALIGRIRELWLKNTTQRAMLDTLRAEGFDVNERALMRVRARHGLLLRKPNPSVFEARETAAAAAAAAAASASNSAEPSAQQSQVLLDALTPVEAKQEASGTIQESAVAQSESALGAAQETPPTPISRKRKEDLQVEDSLKWQARKRRRHTKPFAGLPPDEPGPPRYPSETTIGECQNILGLDTAAYKALRQAFGDICIHRQIVKKSDTLAIHWDAAKQDVVEQIAPLQNLFQSVKDVQGDMSPLHLALDAICIDVTKHLRIQKRKMTLAQAKNILNVNPAKSQELRSRLLHLLSVNGFVNKHESLNGQQIKDQWLNESGLQAIIDSALPGTEHQDRTRAVAMLHRDYMKRWRDAVVSGDVAKFQKFGHGAVPPEPIVIPTSQPETGSGPDLAGPVSIHESSPHVDEHSRGRYSETLTTAELLNAEQPGLASEQANVSHAILSDENPHDDVVPLQRGASEPPLDPNLLQTAQDSSAVVAAALARVQEAEMLDVHEQQQPPRYFDQPIQVVFRRSDASLGPRQGGPTIWSGTLTTCTIDSLRKAALDGYTAEGRLAHDVIISAIDGVASSPEEPGKDMHYHIDDDFELGAFLNHVGVTSSGGSNGPAPSATFSILLTGAND